jgi:hypothetical protein
LILTFDRRFIVYGSRKSKLISFHYALGILRPLFVRPEVARGILKVPLPTLLLATLEATVVSLPSASAEVGATCLVVALDTLGGVAGIGSGAGGGAGAFTLTHILVFSLYFKLFD